MPAANGPKLSVHHSVATDRWARVLGVLFFVLVTLAPESGLSQSTAEEADLGPFYTNSIGMRLARIPSGSFVMGSESGDWDEEPLHRVMISRPFYMGAYEVTNEQYEQFDPAHHALRGKAGFSTEDDEAVVFVSWDEATAFTQWLSAKEGRPYRLPTEAEWEYAARAGTTGPYSTGGELPRSMLKNGVVSLAAGFTQANPWGLFDMHGNIAEWTQDWYGPYPGSSQVDPVGRVEGDVRVTRGGSHSRGPEFLRSSNRMGALPDDRTQFIGFRVVLGDPPTTAPLQVAPEELHQLGVDTQLPPELELGGDPEHPFFEGPRLYVKLTPSDRGPFSEYNFVRQITAMPNGDLLAVWSGGGGMELASRLRYGQEEWDPASVFWSVPDHLAVSALWWDGRDTVYHVASISWRGSLALVLRTSTDSGRSWSKARFIARDQVGEGPTNSLRGFQDGTLVVTMDETATDSWFLVSRDGGATWEKTGGRTTGYHAAIVRLNDGSLLAATRNGHGGRMLWNRSTDDGESWSTWDSEFPDLGHQQRPVLLRLASGNLFLASFAESMVFKDERGNEFLGSGLFGAISKDEGRTWPIKRLIVPEGPPSTLLHHRFRHDRFSVSDQTAEPEAYIASTQGKDGVIHLLTEAYHYAFNEAWLETPPSESTLEPPPEKTRLHTVIDGGSRGGQPWPGPFRFDGRGLEKYVVTTNDGGPAQVHVPQGRAFRWLDAQDSGFGSARPDIGATIEIEAAVVTDQEPPRTDRDANEQVSLGVTVGIPGLGVLGLRLQDEGLYAPGAWIPFEPSGPGLPHRVRLAVRPDGIFRVYVDGQLRVIKSMLDDGLFDYGDGETSFLLIRAQNPINVVIHEISYDLTGAYAPGGDD
jgi:formylglycine-generating enzyme required for sulfatase activity